MTPAPDACATRRDALSGPLRHMPARLRQLASSLVNRTRADDGGIALLGIGLCTCVVMLLLGGICVHTAQVARVDVLDAADHAGAAAADRISVAHAYAHGVEAPQLDAASVRAEAQAALSATERPAHVTSWSLTSASVDGKDLVLAVAAVVDPPAVGGALSALGAPITVHVTTRAEAHFVR